MTTRHELGQSLVETSLILAAFMALVLGMVFVAQTLFVKQTFAQRAHDAARWGAVNSYDPQAIRDLVLYGTPTPLRGATPFMGLKASEVLVASPGCPGTQCRVSVAIPAEGVHSTEPAESDRSVTDAALSKP